MSSKARVLYIPHGGGPMPLLGDPGHAGLIQYLRDISRRVGQPEAILVISAHWEMPVPCILGAAAPPMLYDYGGFPPETYQISYPAPGDPVFAENIRTLLADQGMHAMIDPQRGYDHGAFVPLMLMYPDADIPCLQISLLNNLDGTAHIALGQALAPLLEKNVLVLGSGMSFHNLRAFFVPGMVEVGDNMAFESWLQETCTADISESERAQRLADWHLAPGGRLCHPRPEHLLPLHVCYGMAGKAGEVVFSGDVMGRNVTGVFWG
jgi:4,5-DOPA dioxygenase extradiol